LSITSIMEIQPLGYSNFK